MAGQEWWSNTTTYVPEPWVNDAAENVAFSADVAQSTWEGMRSATSGVMEAMLWGNNGVVTGLGFFIVLGVLAVFARMLWAQVGTGIEGAKIYGDGRPVDD